MRAAPAARARRRGRRSPRSRLARYQTAVSACTRAQAFAAKLHSTRACPCTDAETVTRAGPRTPKASSLRRPRASTSARAISVPAASLPCRRPTAAATHAPDMPCCPRRSSPSARSPRYRATARAHELSPGGGACSRRSRTSLPNCRQAADASEAEQRQLEQALRRSNPAAAVVVVGAVVDGARLDVGDTSTTLRRPARRRPRPRRSRRCPGVFAPFSTDASESSPQQ